MAQALQKGVPGHLNGKAAIEKQYGPLPTAYTGMRYPVSSIRSTDDPNIVIVEFEGRIGLKSGGRYDNRYVGMFAFNSNGKLVQYTEYFDPFVLLNGFPGAKLMSAEGPRQSSCCISALGMRMQAIAAGAMNEHGVHGVT